MNTVLYPSHFTNKEGGEWIECPKGYVVAADSLERRDTHFTVAIVDPEKVRSFKYYIVHSFLFNTYREKESEEEAPRWDVINGWTTKIRGIEQMNPIGNSIPEALSPLMLEASNTIARQAEEIATLAQQIATFTEQYASLTVQNANAQEQIIELKTKLAAPTRKEELLTAYILGQVPDDNRDAVQNRLNKWLAKQLGE